MSTSASSEGVSDRLAALIARTAYDDIPPPIRHEALRSLMNFFACALGGCRDAAVESTLAVLTQFSGERCATVIGRRERIDPLSAAFLNAASANVFDFDDTHLRTILHPSAPVAAALFALAQRTPIPGSQLLLAFVLGVEAECRIANAISPGHYRRGWHITSTCGVFGAAAASAKALGLSALHTRWALGNASAQAGGLLETLGSMAKSVSVGNAARNGVAAALYAKHGVAGPDRPLEGPYGFLRVTGEDPDFACMTEGLGERWEIGLNTYKPYPCGIVLNPVIEACLTLAREAGFSAADVQRIEITGHPLLRERTDRVRPQSGREAQVSAQHSVAVALTYARAGLPEFSDARAADPALNALREKVCFVDDPGYSVESATLTLHTSEGRKRSLTIDHARGSSSRPLPDSDLEQKLRDLDEYGASGCEPGRLIDAIWALETAPDAGAVVALAAGAG